MPFGFNSDRSKTSIDTLISNAINTLDTTLRSLINGKLSQRNLDVSYDEPTGGQSPDMFVKPVYSTFTIAANASNLVKTINDIDVDGYKSIGVVGHDYGGTTITVQGCCVLGQELDTGSYVSMTVRNTSSSSVSFGIHVYVLYISENLLENAS